MKQLARLALLAALFSLTTLAQSGPVVGSTANAQFKFSTIANPSFNQNAVVGSGVEFTRQVGALVRYEVDLSDTQIILSLSTTANQFTILADYSWQITLASNLVFDAIDKVSDSFATGASLTGFSAQVATFQFKQGTFNPGSWAAVYNISVRDLNAVPEPASLALVVVALLGTIAVRRSRA